MRSPFAPPNRWPSESVAFPRCERSDASRTFIFSDWLAQVCDACGAFEWVTLTYLSFLNTLIFIFRKNLSAAPRYLLIHFCLSAGILLLAWAARRWNHSALRFLRHWYFLPLWTFLFEELTGLVHIIFPGWFDSWLIRFDYALTGVYPWDWFAQFTSPALNDLMQFAYLTYFFALVALPAILYVRGEQRAFWLVLTSMALAHYAVYAIAVLLPIESPFHAFPALQHEPLPGGPATWAINWIERFGRVHGAAFPSAHVAGAFAALLGAWRYRRWVFWMHLPLFILMVISTVYGRYHYVGDALAGLLAGAAAFALAHRLMQSQGAVPQICTPESEAI
jgi:membrane-associated phospholipid phosphatase